MIFHPSSPVLLPVRHIQQRNSGECLVACVAMILQHLNVPTSYERLSNILQIEPSIGTSFAIIHRLEALVGTVTYCKHGTLEILYDYLVQGWPCITAVETRELPYWRQISTRHAVVVVGMDDEHIYLNDPEFSAPLAPIRVALGDFDLAWLERDERYAVLTLGG